MPASARRSALVTGGTGTVGRVVVLRLLADGWNVRVLTRTAEGTGSNGVTYVRGNLDNRRTIVEAVEDCDLVVHCAITGPGAAAAGGVNGGTNLDEHAAGDLADAAISAGVRRFVHVSTISVYPILPAGTIEESLLYVPETSNDAYALMKARIEATLLTRADRLHLGILQPANVVSPNGGWWTSGVVELMRKGRFILVDGGAGTANLIGVDDVAAAAGLAAVAEYKSGARFLLADGHPIPWRGYLQHLEQLAGGDGLEEMTADEAKRYSRAAVAASVSARVARRIARGLTGKRPVLPMDDRAIDRFASRAVVSAARAERDLGFSPAKTRWPLSVPGAPPLSVPGAPPPSVPGAPPPSVQ